MARPLLHRRRARPMKPVAEAEESRQPLIHCRDLFPRKLPKHPPDPPLIDRSQMVDQRERFPGETARAGRKRRIEQSLAGSPCYRHHAHQRKALIAYHVWIAHHHARPRAMLFVTGCGVEFHQDDGGSTGSHSLPSTQPSPGTQRTASPVLLSTRYAL